MKADRHQKIVELISTHEIDTQEALAALLEESGFSVTQATVSRDIRELGLCKLTTAPGVQRYAIFQPKESSLNEKYTRVFREAFVSMDRAQNILVIKTVSGMAMAVATALDSLQFSEMVGCIAGDDVIMCAVRSVDDTILLMQKLTRLLDNQK